MTRRNPRKRMSRLAAERRRREAEELHRVAWLDVVEKLSDKKLEDLRLAAVRRRGPPPLPPEEGTDR